MHFDNVNRLRAHDTQLAQNVLTHITTEGDARHVTIYRQNQQCRDDKYFKKLTKCSTNLRDRIVSQCNSESRDDFASFITTEFRTVQSHHKFFRQINLTFWLQHIRQQMKIT